MRELPPIDGSTRLVGLIGHGLGHTWSPTIHNRAAALLGVNAVYVPFDLSSQHVPALLDLHWELGSYGFNVTTPHKELVASIVKEPGIRSANTVYRGESGWRAASTDAEGYACGLKRMGRPLESFNRVVILGSGGVVSALLAYFAGILELAEAFVLRRRKDRDHELRQAAGRLPVEIRDLTEKDLDQVLRGRGAETLLIQATSAPLRGDSLDWLTPALEGFGGVVSDLVYGKPSALYFKAVALDLVAQDGEAMLVEQARLSQVLWWGRAAPFDALIRAIRAR